MSKRINQPQTINTMKKNMKRSQFILSTAILVFVITFFCTSPLQAQKQDSGKSKVENSVKILKNSASSINNLNATNQQPPKKSKTQKSSKNNSKSGKSTKSNSKTRPQKQRVQKTQKRETPTTPKKSNTKKSDN